MRASQAPVETNRVREVSAGLLLGALALVFGILVARKQAAFARSCEARGASPRGLVPLSPGGRAVLAGAALAGAVALEASELPLAGAALVAVATLAAALRRPDAKQAVRGPGRWLALRPEEAFPVAPRARHWMDIDGAAGRASMAACAVLAAVLAVLARRFSPEGPWLVALDAMALVPLFVTGRAAQLPPDGELSSAPWLRRAFDLLRAPGALRAVPWGRVIVDGSKVDELRLLVLPRAAMPGVAGIELGLAWSSTPVGWSGSPEVLVRVLDGSPAAARLARAGSLGSTLPGVAPTSECCGSRPGEGRRSAPCPWLGPLRTPSPTGACRPRRRHGLLPTAGSSRATSPPAVRTRLPSASPSPKPHPPPPLRWRRGGGEREQFDVRRSINLDHEASLPTVEVDDVPTDRVLTAKAHPLEPTATQVRPKHGLCASRVRAHVPRAAPTACR